MSEEQAFIDQINADPWNFGLRCIYADWLDDHDDPRAGPMRELAEMGKVPAHLPSWWEWFKESWVNDPVINETLRWCVRLPDDYLDEQIYFMHYPTPFEAIDAVVRYRLTRLAVVTA